MSTRKKRINYDRELVKYLRTSLIPNWRRDSIESCNGKCIISGDDFEVVHHLYPCNLILREALENLDMPKYGNIQDYEESDLLKLKDEFIRLHYHYGLGICLTDKIHREFHDKMGLNAKPEDFELYKHYKINGLDLEEIKKCDISNKYTDKRNIKIYIKELKYILENLSKSYNEALVLFALLVIAKKYSSENKEFFASGDTIREYAPFTRPTIYEKTNILNDKKLINKTLRFVAQNGIDDFIRLPNQYKLNFLNDITYEDHDEYVMLDTSSINKFSFIPILAENLNKKYLKSILPKRKYEDVTRHLSKIKAS